MIKHLLLLYQKARNFVGAASPCRHHPTCSQYAIEAIEKYGNAKGSYLALKRLISCNQWFQGGYDPVR